MEKAYLETQGEGWIQNYNLEGTRASKAFLLALRTPKERGKEVEEERPKERERTHKQKKAKEALKTQLGAPRGRHASTHRR